MREIEGGEFREHLSCENHHMEGFAGRICTECGCDMKPCVVRVRIVPKKNAGFFQRIFAPIDLCYDFVRWL